MGAMHRDRKMDTSRTRRPCTPQSSNSESTTPSSPMPGKYERVVSKPKYFFCFVSCADSWIVHCGSKASQARSQRVRRSSSELRTKIPAPEALA